MEMLLRHCPRRVIKLGAVLLANRRMMRTTSQLMVYLEPVTMKTPFGPAKPARKKARRRDIYLLSAGRYAVAGCGKGRREAPR